MSNDRKRISIGSAAALVEDCVEAGLVPLILGQPGTGKTAMIAEVAERFNLKLIGHNLTTSEPTDLTGFPNMDKVVNGVSRSCFSPPDMFPLEGDDIPEGYDGWLLNLDELTSAALEVQVASHKLIHEKKVGQHNLHPACAIVATGNEIDDGNLVNDMGTAMQSRLCTLHVRVDEEEFMNYARKSGMDFRLRGFLTWKPDMIHHFDPNHDDDTFACPRTNEAISDLLKLWPEVSPSKLPLMVGTTGPAHANALYGYCKIYGRLPSIIDLASDPLSVTIPDNPDVRFALATLIGEAIDTTNAEDMMTLVEKLPLEFQVLALTSAAHSNPTIQTDKFVINWFVDNAKELY